MNLSAPQPSPAVAAPATLTQGGVLLAARAVLHKDLRLELRARARANALIFFAFATFLLFSFAMGPDTLLMRRHAGGYLWLAVLLASVLALSESMRVERDNRALEALLAAPADPRGVFLGKALGNALMLTLLGAVLIPIMVALFDVQAEPAMLPKLGAVIVLGTAGISAPGTLLAAISANAKAKDLLLPLLLFPLLIPVLLACVKATTLVLDGDPMGDGGAWLSLLIAFNVVYWALGLALFPMVVDE